MDKHDYQFALDLGLLPANQRYLEARERGVSLDTAVRDHKTKQRRKSQHPEVTYFIQAENGLIKIGKTRNLKYRLRELQISNAAPLKVLGVTDIEERKVQQRFLGSKVRGEWYQDSPELQHYIKINSWAFDG